MSFLRLVRAATAAAIALIFKIVHHCKIARFSTANMRTFGAERARKTQKKRADSFQRLSMQRHALLRVQGCVGRRWARVACKTCAETRGTSRDSPENHGF